MENKEIGGYIELDRCELPMLHEEGYALNCGRNCLVYLIRARQIKKILLPKFLCDSIESVCIREQVEVKYYSIGENFLPVNINQDNDEWVYIVNYYGQIGNKKIKELAHKYKNIIIDHAQAYFQMPVQGIDTLYTCRKFFGVADGAFLFTDVHLEEEIDFDESYNRINFLVGRFERTAPEFYKEYVYNNERFRTEAVKRMSKLTENMLRSINYNIVREKREKNFEYLHKYLHEYNKLKLFIPKGAFMYPFYISNGMLLRKKLQEKKIYIPILWPNVLQQCRENELEYDMACNILPLPVDQRYDYSEMDIIVSSIKQYL